MMREYLVSTQRGDAYVLYCDKDSATSGVYYCETADYRRAVEDKSEPRWAHTGLHMIDVVMARTVLGVRHTDFYEVADMVSDWLMLTSGERHSHDHATHAMGINRCKCFLDSLAGSPFGQTKSHATR